MILTDIQRFSSRSVSALLRSKSLLSSNRHQFGDAVDEPPVPQHRFPQGKPEPLHLVRLRRWWGRRRLGRYGVVEHRPGPPQSLLLARPLTGPPVSFRRVRDQHGEKLAGTYDNYQPLRPPGFWGFRAIGSWVCHVTHHPGKFYSRTLTFVYV
jgi:hypothetical protein